jgi:RNA-directed DNA polymerase
MEKFGVALHPEKTRLIEFGRFAAENRQKRGAGKPETFTFLGLTQVCGRKRWSGGFIANRKTAAKRLWTKLGEVKEALMRRRHEPIPVLGAWLLSVVRGYFNYHGVPGDTDSMESFRTATIRHWLKALRRRSQRHRMPWERFDQLVDRWIPKVQVLHPYPDERFYAEHPK